jgi:outer membrane lipoprotein-sorting protein
MTTAFRSPRRSPALRRRVLILAGLATLAACAAPTPPLVLNDEDSRAVTQIAHYLDDLKSFQASFTQSGAFGDGTGTVWLDRPGHLRIEYAGSPGKTLVANNGRVVVYDGATGGTTTMPVSRTPLGMLLTPSITLTGPVTVTAYRHEAAFSELTIKKTDAPGDGSLTLFFSPPPLALTAVMLTDAYDRPLLMHLSNIRLNPPLTPPLFQYPGLHPGS